MFSPAFGQDWCFFPNTNTDPDTCPYRRVECGKRAETQRRHSNRPFLSAGFLGIDQDECESRGCCWYPLEQGSAEPWCFHSIYSEPTAVAETTPEEPTGETTPPPEEPTEATIPAPEEPTEEMPIVELPSELAGMMFPEEGEGLGVRTLPEESPAAEAGQQTEEPATEALAEAPAVAESVTVLPNEHSQDETSQAMELNSDIDTFDNPIPKSADFQNHQDGFLVACEAEALTEHDCLAITECYWVPEVTPGFGACMKRLSDPGRRSMGKFFKPKTIY